MIEGVEEVLYLVRCCKSLVDYRGRNSLKRNRVNKFTLAFGKHGVYERDIDLVEACVEKQAVERLCQKLKMALLRRWRFSLARSVGVREKPRTRAFPEQLSFACV